MANSVWQDLYPDDPGKVAQMEARSYLMMSINERVREEGWNERQTAEHLGITEPQASALINGRLSQFSIKKLVKLLAPLGLVLEVRRRATIEERGHEQRQGGFHARPSRRDSGEQVPGVDGHYGVCAREDD
ncbi:XRE family transcriptional regulator [Mycolicibacterium farcinogenes]|nr:XRE family transcriptional regulator [Mycolicibacterium farcinogenes]